MNNIKAAVSFELLTSEEHLGVVQKDVNGNQDGLGGGMCVTIFQAVTFILQWQLLALHTEP